MSAARNPLLELVGIELPIIQAPMAGVSSPAMAAAVSNAGGLGSIGVGATNAEGARAMIAAVRMRSNGPVNVNVFCHRPAQADPRRESAWIERFAPEFAKLGAPTPASLNEIYRSFLADDEMLATLVAERPRVVSFHFGLPSAERVRALKEAGIILFASATSLAEARQAASAGVDAIVAQGHEAGGHRGVFDPDAEDNRLGAMALTRILAREIDLPSSSPAASWMGQVSRRRCASARRRPSSAPPSSGATKASLTRATVPPCSATPHIIRP